MGGGLEMLVSVAAAAAVGCGKVLATRKKLMLDGRKVVVVQWMIMIDEVGRGAQWGKFLIGE